MSNIWSGCSQNWNSDQDAHTSDIKQTSDLNNARQFIFAESPTKYQVTKSSIWTNTFYTLNKYILILGQILGYKMLLADQR